MTLAVFETWLESDLRKPVQVKQLTGNLFSADNGGNKIGVKVYDGGQTATLSGAVTGYIIREDGQTVVVAGSLSDNKAFIVLPSSAYLVVGRVSIVIKVGATTVGACTAYVYRTTTDTIVDPANVVPSLSELLAKISDCEAATNAANTAASNANTKATLADQKATLADQKATAANNAASAANTAAGKIDNMTIVVTSGGATQDPTAMLTLENGHYKITFANIKGMTGDAFHIVKTYASIAAMEADFSGTDTNEGDLVMIVSNVQDPDNAKVYVKGASAWGFIVDMSGSAGIQGQQAFVWIRYASAEPTQDSDMKTTADKWMGIYSGTDSSAPTTYTSYTWFKIKGEVGATGNASYVHFKWSANEPTQDSDLKDTVDNWIGVYSGTSATAPTSYTSYTWFKYKGETGNTGTAAHVYFRWSASEPTQDSDMKTVPDAWIGVYSGTASSAPTTYTSYVWYRYKGETPTVYANTIALSSSDSTKISEALATKATKVTGATSGNLAGLDGNGNLTDSGKAPADFVAVNQGSGNAGKALGIANDGSVTPVPFSGDDFTGATALSDGVHGYVPKPLAGDEDKFLKGDGTWGTAGLPSSDIVDLIYPVGSVYMSVVATAPSTLFGGTWERLKDRFLLGASEPEIPAELVTSCETILLNNGTTAEELAEMSDYEKWDAAHTLDSVAIRDLTDAERGHPAGSTGGAASQSYTPAGTNSGGAVGNHTLTTAEIPSHSHGLNSHTHSYNDYYANTSTGQNNSDSGSTTISFSNGYANIGISGNKEVYNIPKQVTAFTATYRAVVTSSGSISSNYSYASTLGGSQAHTHKLNNHTHTVSNTYSSRTTGGASGDTTSTGDGGAHSHGFTQPTFTGDAADISSMPPYLSVYMWKRTA